MGCPDRTWPPFPALAILKADSLWGEVSLDEVSPPGSHALFMSEGFAALFLSSTSCIHLEGEAGQCQVRSGAPPWQTEAEFLRLSPAPARVFTSPSLQNRHCLLDVAPHAIERLHHMHIYPIVIFIHYKSDKHVK